MMTDLKFEDLVIAYRKAKADIHYESGHLTALKFATYEENLTDNLNSLLSHLQSTGKKYLSGDFVGGHAYIVKKIQVEPSKTDKNVFFSKSERNWEPLELKDIAFRIIGQHSVDMHILSSLWIDKVGALLEEKVGNQSYGCRLKRSFQKDGQFIDYENPDNNDIEKMELGHFRPYIGDYKRWQANGIKAIENALTEHLKIVAITADIKSFYHSIEPSFLLNKQFLDFIGFEYNSEQEHLTKVLVTALQAWSKNVCSDNSLPSNLKCNNVHTGVPVGLAAAKVIANLVLIYLDEKIKTELGPIYYGRYVDDIFLVLQDNGNIKNSEQLWDFISTRIESIKRSGSNNSIGSLQSTDHEVVIPYAINSKIVFNSKKEKLFILEGSSGETFIKTLKNALDENSSEWRMLPESESELDSLAQDMAKASSDHEEDVTGLRKSDGISIQRLNFAIRLKNFESVVELLPKDIWKKGVADFFKLTEDFVLVPEKLATYLKYHPRIIRLAIRAEEPEVAKKMWDRIDENWIELKSKIDNELDKVNLEKAQLYHTELLNEAVYSSLNLRPQDQ